MSEWQPIETAPEGVVVDIWLRCGLKESFRQQMQLPEQYRLIDCVLREGIWWDTNRDDPLRADLISHWMPRPDAPE